MKKLIVFDLDGTLAPSKSALGADMAALLHDLLGIVKVAVISEVIGPVRKQLLSSLPQDERLVNLSVLPTCGTKFFQYSSQWKDSIQKISLEGKRANQSSLQKAFGEAGSRSKGSGRGN